MKSILAKLIPSRKALVDSILDASCITRGEHEFSKGLEIRGSHFGPLTGQEGSVLVIAQGACIEGAVEADTVILHGKVKGSVKARKSLIVGATGLLAGEALYMTVQVAEGARIEGRMRSMDESNGTHSGVVRRPRTIEMPVVEAPLSA